MPERLRGYPDRVDPELYSRACAVEGYFTESEASLLMRAIQMAGPSPVYLEIGSFRGRSTLFALSAMPAAGRLLVVDAFIYAEHSLPELKASLDDPRISILTGTLITNWAALSVRQPDVVLIDADHSFAGVALDLALSISLSHIGGLIATHDFSDRFPGVNVAVRSLVDDGVLAAVERVGDLAVWSVCQRPGWLVDPRPEIDWELPPDMGASVPTIVELARGCRKRASPNAAMTQPASRETAAVSTAADTLARDRRVVDAYVYGSALRTDHVPGTSDIDFLVVVAEDTSLPDYEEIAAAVRQQLPQADVTVVTERELESAIHPSGSRHFFVSVALTGEHLHGRNALQAVATDPLDFNETYRNVVQLCQRVRLVLINPAKHRERDFWLEKLQHWVPCLLMELLHLHGAPERRLRRAQIAFAETFAIDWARVAYPYKDLNEVQSFMEALVRWLPTNGSLFTLASGDDSPRPKDA